MTPRGARTELLRQIIVAMLKEGYSSDEIKACMQAQAGNHPQPGQGSLLERLKPPPPLKKEHHPKIPLPTLPLSHTSPHAHAV